MAFRPQVALIGVSGYARIYYELLRELHDQGSIQLRSATVVNASEEPAIIAELTRIGCPVYGDHREMLGQHTGQIDLCCIPTGTPLHASMAIAALEAGANVLVEKPLAPTTWEVEAIRAAEHRQSRFAAVGFQDIYTEETWALKRRLLAGEIGPLRRIKGRGLWPRDTGYYRRNNWAGRRQLEGNWVFDSPLSNAFSHFLNLALFFAGPAFASSAAPATVEVDLLRAQPVENFDTAALRVRLVDGVEILFYVSHSSKESIEPELFFEGDGGRAIWRYEREFRLQPARGQEAQVPLLDAGAVRRAMFKQVLRRLSDPTAFVCGTAIAAEHTRCCQMAQDSPVIPVAEQWLRRIPTPSGEEQISITGIEDLVSRSWAAAQLFSEIGYPWPCAAGSG